MPKRRPHPRRRPDQENGPRGDGGPHSLWSGSISFGLVSVPVDLYSAQSRARPALRMLSPEGTPLARQYVCPKDGTVLDADQIERGYEVRDGEFITVSDEELERLAPRSSRDIDLVRFVDREEIDPSYFERAYILIPGAEQTKAYRLLAEVMERRGRAGVANFVMRGKGYSVAIFADRGVLRAETLRAGDELRPPEDLDLPEPEKPPERLVKQMRKAIDALAAEDLDEAELVDQQVKRLIALAESKARRGKDVVEVPEAAEEGSVRADIIDLMAVLKERMAQSGAGECPARKAKKAARDSDGLKDASRDELYRRARELDIPGRSKMSKDQLLESVRRAS